MNMEITREMKILKEIHRQEMPSREWMLDLIAEIGNAKNWQSVSTENIQFLIARHPNKESFRVGAERYLKFHVHPTKPDSDPIALQARVEARQASQMLEKIIYG